MDIPIWSQTLTQHADGWLDIFIHIQINAIRWKLTGDWNTSKICALLVEKGSFSIMRIMRRHIHSTPWQQHFISLKHLQPKKYRFVMPYRNLFSRLPKVLKHYFNQHFTLLFKKNTKNRCFWCETNVYKCIKAIIFQYFARATANYHFYWLIN